MILVGIGSNLAALGLESPLQTAEAALMRLPAGAAQIVRCSQWYESAPVPASDQPWFVNAVLQVASPLEPSMLLHALLTLEKEFGRHRSVPNAARTLDLDLLDYDGRLYDTAELTLPHPRLHERRFVLAPLAEIFPDWHHPRLGASAAELLAKLPPGQPIRVLR